MVRAATGAIIGPGATAVTTAGSAWPPGNWRKNPAHFRKRNFQDLPPANESLYMIGLFHQARAGVAQPSIFASALVGVLFIQSEATATEAAGTSPEGVWVGSCDIDHQAVFLRVRLLRGSGRVTGAAQVRSLGVRAAPLEQMHAEDNRLAFSFQTPSGPVRLQGQLTGTLISGTVEFGESRGRFLLRRRYDMDAATFDSLTGNYELDPDNAVLIARSGTVEDTMFIAEGDRRLAIVPIGPREFLSDDLRAINFEVDPNGRATAAIFTGLGQSPKRALRVHLYDAENVSFASGDVRLAGTVFVPLGVGPHPALVFVHGSGPHTRPSFHLNADQFARAGIAVLFFDKRGAGESTGDWHHADFDVLADDVLAGVRFMRRHPRIRADKIGLWGISQAGWIIPLAASRSADIAFVIPISGGAVTPAEQEAWRRGQNLSFFGVPARFVEIGRKAAVLAFDWQRQNQLGRIPIPNPFAEDELNMYHDAAAVLRKVRQPVLAIFGGLDTLTPPRESAAIWADALRHRGDDDFSVRLFPRGTHGLMVGEKTGSPFEVVRESRSVPGYNDAVVSWIRHHAGGPEFAAVRQVDVAGTGIPVESRGLDRLSWYGTGMVQPWILLALLILSTLAVLAAPLGWLVRRVRRAQDSRRREARRAVRLSSLWGMLNLAIIFAFVYVLYQVAQADPHPLFEWLATAWNLLVAATWLSLVLGGLIVRECVAAWRGGWRTVPAGAYYAQVAAAAISWVPFVFYWDLLWPAW